MNYVEVFLVARAYGHPQEVEIGPSNAWAHNLAFRFRHDALRHFDGSAHPAPDPADDAAHFALACRQVDHQLDTSKWQIFMPDGTACSGTATVAPSIGEYDPFPPNHSWTPEGWDDGAGAAVSHPTRAYLLHIYYGGQFRPYYENFQVRDPNGNVVRVEYWIVVRKI